MNRERAGAVGAVLVAGSVGWEEKQLLKAAERMGAELRLVGVEALCLPSPKTSPPVVTPTPVAGALREGATVLLRCSSYFTSVEASTGLEALGCRVINTAHHLALFGRKTATDAWLAANDVPVVPSCVLFSLDAIEALEARFPYPIVIKPIVGGFGRRVQLLESRRELEHAWEYLSDFAPAYHRFLYVQQRIRVRRDVRVTMLDGAVLSSIERRNETAFAKNVAQGGEARPHALEPSEEALVRTLSRLLPTGFFGLDLLVDADGSVFVCEVNATCGFRGAATATGVDVAGALLQSALRPRR